MDYSKEKATILIVDDQPLNLKILGNILKSEYDIKVTTTGEEAIKISTGNNPPDLILLDIMMPGTDGYEVCKKLKKMEITRDIPIIFVTGKSDETDEELGLSLGAIDYITKPFSIPIIKARIKNHLELKYFKERIRESSMIDGLTNIANRKKFNERINLEWYRSKRHQDPLSLIMLDIDFFKKYNDEYGHLAGDECLKKVAETIQSSCKRSTDLVARWGGEEFACVLPSTNLSQAKEIAEEIRKNIMKLQIPHKKSEISDIVTVSSGVSEINYKEKTMEILIEKADKALYNAKSNGRNRVSILV